MKVNIYIKIKLHQFVNGKSISNFHIWPYMALGGGEMISDVFLDHSTFAQPPSRLVNCKGATLSFSFYFNMKICFGYLF